MTSGEMEAKQAYALWESLQQLSDQLWNRYGDDFITFFPDEPPEPKEEDEVSF